MRFHARRTAPQTSNEEAALLIRQAEANCAKCRTDWRLFPTDGLRFTYVHRDKTPCRAPVERQKLREIAARNRA